MDAFDATRLRKSEFWNKKMDKRAATYDVDKKGFIERADFQKVLAKYRRSSVATEANRDSLSKTFMTIPDGLGLVDDSVKLTYSEFKEKFIEAAEQLYKDETTDNVFMVMFENLDANKDGVIQFREWRAHTTSLGISLEDAQASFDAMDVDHDGVISKEEFIAYHKEFFYSTEDKLNSSILFGPLD